MEARTRLICNLGTRDFFRLTDEETDTTLYPQIWYRTDYTVKRDGKKKYECYQANGEKYVSFINASRRVYPLDKAEADEIRKAMAEAAARSYTGFAERRRQRKAEQIWKAMEEAAKEAVKNVMNEVEP